MLEQRLVVARSVDVLVPVRTSEADAPENAEAEEAVSARDNEATRSPPTESFDDEAPQWPDETAESAFLSEQRATGESPGAAKTIPQPEQSERETENFPLPALQSLVDRIPTEAKDVLEELFRARFVAVRQVPKHTLKRP